MKRSMFQLVLLVLVFALGSQPLFSHGLMESPASRNQFCGVITKPDEVANGTAEYPECGDAFATDFNGGYSFMSVLTHDVGRAGVTPLPQNVCSFDSETFNGQATPWDTPIDWPTNNLSSGRNEIVWNISWGPHFDDTEEFRYWITKPGFQYQVGVPLTWNDFEDQAFCVLTYDDSNPTANPDVIADKGATRFHTYCDVPERSGRHVIYGEWGRNFFTFERFHGCIDAVFGPVDPNQVNASFTVTPNVSEVVGVDTLSLDASGSTGTGLSYQWSVSAPDAGLYSFTNPTGVTTDLSFGDPAAAATVTVTLTVSNGSNSDTATGSFSHVPDSAVSYELLGPLTAAAQTLEIGDRVQVRVVLDNGQDLYFPADPLVITSAYTAADAWPPYLAAAVNGATNDIAVGVLDGNGDVNPVADATANQIYKRLGSNVAGAFLNVTSTSSTCEYVLDSEWDTGFTATIRITNSGTAAINTWTVGWEYTDGSQIEQLWNASYSGNNPFVASNLNWNGLIEPGQSASFGFKGIKGGSSAAQIPTVTGSVCQ